MVYLQIKIIIVLTLPDFHIYTAITGAVSIHYHKFKFYKGIDCITTQLFHTNGFVESVRPWELRKDPEILNVMYIVPPQQYQSIPGNFVQI